MTATQQQAARAFRFAPVLLFGALLLQAGCSGTGGVVRGAPASVDRAERLQRQGNHLAAAQMYESLAGENPAPAGNDYALSAAREWLAASRPADAQRVLAAFTAGLTPAQSFERAMLHIEVQLASGAAADAWRALLAQGEPRAPLQAARFLGLQRRAAFATSRPVEGVRAGVALERLANTDTDRLAVRKELLSQLRAAADNGVKLEPTATREPLLRGWLELGIIAANAGRNPLGAAGEIERWRARYQGHPGITIAQAEILGTPSPTTGTAMTGSAPVGGQVALLLPLTGPQATAATIARDGFFSAWSQLPQSTRPSISVHDTGAMSVEEALARASNEDAQFIVGPLTRDEVAVAASSLGRRTPMLALNFLPVGTPTASNLYQFALSPEDEARQIARRALAAGQRRAIVIAPTGDWGTRVVAAFREELLAGGGDVIAHTSYDPKRNEFTAGITDALRINESRARHKRLEGVLGTSLQFEPRRRADVQFIFAASQQPIAARQIRPQLRFYYAGDVPTYMTSDGFEADPSANRDLEGMVFPDMPWILQEFGPVAETRAATQQAANEHSARLPRLFAFGFDAFNLMQALRGSGGKAVAVDGMTGKLSIDQDRHVRRDLDWAQLRNGVPKLIGVVN
ncbi:MAG: penicillin-binding protein activator [Steroidobacteraceae bacterium]